MTMTMGVTGKLYNKKFTPADGNKKARVTFRVSARKRFVSDQDKQDNKTNTFIPMIANGPTAEFINQYFNDGDGICVYDMEYQTYRTQNAPNEYDDAHIFRANNVGFVPGGGEGGNNGGGNGGGNQQRSNNNQRQQPANNGGGNANNRRQAPAPTHTPAPEISHDDLPF